MTQGSFLSPGEGPIYSVSDAVKICLKAGGDMTGGALAFYEAGLEPGFGGAAGAHSPRSRRAVLCHPGYHALPARGPNGGRALGLVRLCS